MKLKLFTVLTCFSILLNSCGDDAKPEVMEMEQMEETNPDPVDEAAIALALERQAVIKTLTATGANIWKINSATLRNQSGSFDISNNFNVLDDEFVFTGNPSGKSITEGNLEWRQNNIVAFLAPSAEETKYEFYISPRTHSFNFDGDETTALVSEGAGFSFNLTDTNEIVGTIAFTENSSMEVSLTLKLPSDYKQVPSSALNFTEAFVFESNMVTSGAPGMIGSLSNESFFFATRESAFNNGTTNPERVIRFDLNTNTVTERLYFNTDFVTKQMNIINNKLYISGGQRINIYDLNLQDEPVSLTDYATTLGQNIGLSRHGTAVVDNTLYLIGGDLNAGLGDKIFTYNLETETMSEWTTMPEPRTGARAEIVNGKLYIFGGTEEFLSPPAKNTIYIYDLETRELTVETMPVPVLLTYTGKIENLIYVGGRNQIETIDENGVPQFNQEPFLGVYDTITGIFTQLESNLTSPENEIIASMAVFNGKLFVVYGQSEAQEEGVLQTWSILSAEI